MANLVSEREKLIGARLRSFRERLQIPRTSFALSIGCGSERLAAYEAGRARLPYSIFRAIHERYALHSIWLADGVGLSQTEYRYPEADILKNLPRTALFTSVYDGHLKPQVIEKQRREKKSAQEEAHLIVNAAKMLQAKTTTEAEKTILRKKMAVYFRQFAENFDSAELQVKIQESALDMVLKEPEYSGLTKAANAPNLDSVKSLWSHLKSRLQKATQASGSKSELAKFLKVELSIVSRWLAESKSSREPGAEYTLRLLQWVEQQERK